MDPVPTSRIKHNQYKVSEHMKEILKHSASQNRLSRREYCILESNRDNEGFHNNIKGNQYQEKHKSFEMHQALRMLLFEHQPKPIRIKDPPAAQGFVDWIKIRLPRENQSLP